MFNVNELTSRLSQMSDPQLQQYARLHKDDPYTLALAAAESKRRAQLRASGQQQAAQGPQPTVADQALAQMAAPAPQPQLPEEQGIGMLPADNVATMADGGIAGYNDQFVDSYADAYAGGGIVAFGSGGMTPEEKAELDRYRQENFARLYGFKDWASGVGQDVADWFSADRSNIPFESKNPAIKYGTPKYTGIMNYERPQAALERERKERGITEQFNAPPPVEKKPGWAVEGKKKGEKSAVPAPIDEGNVYTGRSTFDPNAAKKAEQKQPGTGGPYANNIAGRKAAASQPGATAPVGFVPSQPTTLNAELERLEQFNPGVGQYDVLANKAREGFAGLEKTREEGKPKGEAYAGLEKLLGKEEEKAKGKEEKNLYMSMINAGLATMGGKSQYALQNIAEGAQVGTKQYQEGLEKLEAAALERRKQAAMIEEARRAEARGDWKDAQQLKQKAFETDLGIQEKQIAATQNIWGVNVKTASEMVTAQNRLAAEDRRALMQQQEETKRAEAQNRTSKEVARIYAAMRASAGPSLADKAYDNATRQHQLWLNSPEGKVESMTPGASDRKFLQYLDQANKALNITVPSSAAATTKDSYAGWGQLNVTNPK